MHYCFEPASDLVGELERAWATSDQLFELCGNAWLERPIPYRHPFVFYLGHLPAFAWNQLGRGALGEPPIDEEFEDLFERGIDPGVAEGESEEPEVQWPSVDAIRAYAEQVRAAVREVAPRAPAESLALVLEHELMHHETLTYLLRELDHDKKPVAKTAPESGSGATQGWITVDAGEARLGADRDEVGFGWDNEFPVHRVEVDRFELTRLPITVGEYFAFVQQGGYTQRDHWTDEGWSHLQETGQLHPHGWLEQQGAWSLRGSADDHPLEDVRDWPVMVTQVEAEAYARWHGARLPSEAELHRAAYGSPEGEERAYPWGDAPLSQEHGNFGLQRLDPVPVGQHPAGESAWGALELVGNGWEWTSTTFGPHPGFEVTMPTYPGYSADFFGGAHNVVFGAAWATHPRLLRRSFRNWYQRRYPYATAAFRLARG